MILVSIIFGVSAVFAIEPQVDNSKNKDIKNEKEADVLTIKLPVSTLFDFNKETAPVKPVHIDHSANLQEK